MEFRKHVSDNLLFQNPDYLNEIHRYLMLVLLPLFLCVALFFAVHHVINDEIQKHAELTLDQFYTQSSSMLREMHLFGTSMIHDATFVQSMNADEITDVNYSEFCSYLTTALTNSSYIQHIYVVNESLGRIYSDEGYFDGRSLQAILAKADFRMDAWTSGNQSSAYDIMPCCSIPFYNYEGDQIGILLLTLNFTEFLRNFYTLDARLCSIFREGFSISSAISTIDNTAFDWTDEQAVCNLLGEEVTCFYKETENGTYMVAISNSDYNKPLVFIVAFFCTYALLIFFFGCLSIRKISRRRYEEVSSLINILPNYAGKTDYASIIPEIQKSLSKYRDLQKRADQQIQERNLRYILYDHNKRIISDEFIQSAGIPYPFNKYYCVVTFFIEDVSSTNLDVGSQTDELDLARIMLRSILENLTDSSIGLTSCADSESLVTIFWSDCGENFINNVKGISKKAIDLLYANHTVSIQALLSVPFTDIRRMADAFNKTRDINEFARSIDNRPLILSQEELVSGENQSSDEFFIRQQQILLNTLLAKRYEQIPPMVETILRESVSSLRQNYDLARGRLRTIANILTEAVLASDPKVFSPKEVLAQFRSANSVSELNAVTAKFFSLLVDIDKESADEDNIVQQACRYINENLHDHNLNVSAICEAVNISVQRLTRMFHSHFNTTVADYMNTRRIERAKELLRQNPNMNVAEIAEAVGYNNTPSLTRNFRKLEGLTPSEYRALRL